MSEYNNHSQAESNAQRHFELNAYELYSGIRETIRDEICKVVMKLGRPTIAGPLTTLVLELASNGLKALYKYAFFEFAIKEAGLADLQYDAWNEILKTEIETNYARNFEKICREKSLSLTIRCKSVDDMLRFEIINEGTINSTERTILQALLKEASHSRDLHSYLEIDTTDTSGAIVAEKPGFGLSLVFLTLQSLGISKHNFRISVNAHQTIATLDIPLEKFRAAEGGTIGILSDGEAADRVIRDIVTQLNFGVVIFDIHGGVLEISQSLLDQLALPMEKIIHFPEMIKARFIEDIFSGPFSVALVHSFENYRLKINHYTEDREILYNISGVLNSENLQVETIWQIINLGKDMGTLSEGSIFENVHIQNIIRPYIPNMILEKAHESLRRGNFTLPNEHREATIFFLDIIGFTAKSEALDPAQVIDFLNLSMGIAVKSIEANRGNIDKFIGDGIMAIFVDPLSAVIAAFEIQNNFKGLNEYRRISGEDPIELRIGINTGMVILGSVGTKRRMDWTALGDVVNSASRIEKASEANSVLVSEVTYDYVKDHVVVDRSIAQKVKGKQKEMMLYFLKSINYVSGSKPRYMEL